MTCHFADLAEVLDALGRDTDLSHLPCEKPGGYSTKVTLSRPGQAIDVYTELCEDHDRQAHDIPGYARSVRLRTS